MTQAEAWYLRRTFQWLNEGRRPYPACFFANTVLFFFLFFQLENKQYLALNARVPRIARPFTIDEAPISNYLVDAFRA
jgi:hypothetical protein